MIGKLSGIVTDIFDDHIILNVAGVGYLVHVSEPARLSLQEASPLELFIYTQVREDNISLFGFAHPQEKAVFLQLLSVQRVGAKLALAILGGLGEAQVIAAIQAEDVKTLSQISGVSAKLAERIIGELKAKFAKLFDSNLNASNVGGAITAQSGTQNQALSALTNLGFPKNAAQDAIAKASENLDSDDLQDLIKEALAQLR